MFRHQMGLDPQMHDILHMNVGCVQGTVNFHTEQRKEHQRKHYACSQQSGPYRAGQGEIRASYNRAECSYYLLRRDSLSAPATHPSGLYGPYHHGWFVGSRDDGRVFSSRQCIDKEKTASTLAPEGS